METKKIRIPRRQELPSPWREFLCRAEAEGYPRTQWIEIGLALFTATDEISEIVLALADYENFSTAKCGAVGFIPPLPE